jgi:anti-anti-sigma factor
MAVPLGLTLARRLPVLADEPQLTAKEQVIVLTGEIDLSTAAALERTADHDRYQRIVSDLAAVDHISNRSLIAFCSTLRRLQMHGCTVALHGIDARVQRVLGLVGLKNIEIALVLNPTPVAAETVDIHPCQEMPVRTA